MDFWNRLIRTETGCWEWGGARNHQGYGIFSRQGKDVRAHRHAYALTHGPIPPGLHVCHSCDNPACCNPDHLWLGTAKDNQRDKWQKGRGVVPGLTGSRSPRAKFTPDQVRAIRKRYAAGDISLRRLAAEHDSAFETIREIVTGYSYRDVA